MPTADGSHTLCQAATGEHYHSTNGALAESLHVYIRGGMMAWLDAHPEATAVRILEIGFGTGLDLLLSAEAAHLLGKHLTYVGLEPHLPAPNTLRGLNHGAHLQKPEWAEALYANLETFDPELLVLHGQLGLFGRYHIVHAGLAEFESQLGFDVIFYDAFAPNAQPDLWTPAILQKAFALLNPGGILTSYCVQGNVKRAFREVGGLVQTLPGAPGKRHMLAVHKAS